MGVTNATRRKWQEVEQGLRRLDPDQLARPRLEALGIRCRPVDLIGRRFAIWASESDTKLEPYAIYGSIAGVDFGGSGSIITLIPHPVYDDGEGITHLIIEAQVDERTWEVQCTGGRRDHYLLTLF